MVAVVAVSLLLAPSTAGADPVVAAAGSGGSMSRPMATTGTVPAAAQRGGKVHVGVSVPSGLWNPSALDEFARVAKHDPSMIMWFENWATDFPSQSVQGARQRGAVPAITWELSGGPGSKPADYSLASILAGKHDSYLRRWARAAAQHDRVVFLRLAPEMNGEWVPWASGKVGNTPKRFRKAWRHVVRIFQAADADKVRWVWCPNVPYPGSTHLRKYFPGERWVDWVGLDGYNWGTVGTDTRWQSFRGVFGKGLRQVKALSSKPIMLGEVASTHQGGNKARWIHGFFDGLEARPRIRAFTWFNHDKETDWRIQSSQASARAFAERVNYPRYK